MGSLKRALGTFIVFSVRHVEMSDYHIIIYLITLLIIILPVDIHVSYSTVYKFSFISRNFIYIFISLLISAANG